MGPVSYTHLDVYKRQVVIYRKDGVIAGGNSTYLYSLNSGETTAFELLCASSEEYSYELHALTW